MTPEQALNNLNAAVAAMQLNREQHTTLVQSVEVLRQAIIPKPKEEVKK